MTSSRILLGTIVAFVVVVLGFTVGLSFRDKQEQVVLTPPAALEPVTKADLKAAEEPNFNTYEISVPSTGVLLDSYPVEITHEGAFGIASFPVNGEGSAVKTGQKVFLYETDGELIDTLGEVVGIDQSPGEGLITARIAFEEDEITANKQITKGKIITTREKDVPRLPYSALLRNEKGETYAWEAVEGGDGTFTAYFKRATVTNGNDVLFGVVTDLTSSNLFILNPDEKLRDGQKINVRKYLYNPPSQSEDQRIAALIERRKEFKLSRAQNKALVEGASSSNCAQKPAVTQNFINQIKSLAPTLPVDMPPAAVPSP